MRSRSLALTLVGAPLLLVSGWFACPAPAPAPTPAASFPVRYVQAWDKAGVEPASGGGFALTNDLGYRVTIHRGWLVTFSMELVECKPPTGAWDTLRSLMAPGIAYAGHPKGDLNPAAITTPLVEALHEAGPPVIAGERDPGAVRYCKLHFLVARAPRDLAAAFTEVDLNQVSLYLEGTWQRGDGEPTPFVVKTSVAHGTFAEVEVETGVAGADVILTRRLAGFFDGADFATLTGRQLERHLVKAVVDATSVTVGPYSPRP